MKKCWTYPLCSKGHADAQRVRQMGSGVMIYKDRHGDLKRTPVSEVLTYFELEPAEKENDCECG